MSHPHASSSTSRTSNNYASEEDESTLTSSTTITTPPYPEDVKPRHGTTAHHKNGEEISGTESESSSEDDEGILTATHTITTTYPEDVEPRHGTAAHHKNDEEKTGTESDYSSEDHDGPTMTTVSVTPQLKEGSSEEDEHGSLTSHHVETDTRGNHHPQPQKKKHWWSRGKKETLSTGQSEPITMAELLSPANKDMFNAEVATSGAKSTVESTSSPHRGFFEGGGGGHVACSNFLYSADDVNFSPIVLTISGTKNSLQKVTQSAGDVLILPLPDLKRIEAVVKRDQSKVEYDLEAGITVLCVKLLGASHNFNIPLLLISGDKKLNQAVVAESITSDPTGGLARLNYRQCMTVIGAAPSSVSDTVIYALHPEYVKSESFVGYWGREKGLGGQIDFSEMGVHHLEPNPPSRPHAVVAVRSVTEESKNHPHAKFSEHMRRRAHSSDPSVLIAEDVDEPGVGRSSHYHPEFFRSAFAEYKSTIERVPVSRPQEAFQFLVGTPLPYSGPTKALPEENGFYYITLTLGVRWTGQRRAVAVETHGTASKAVETKSEAPKVAVSTTTTTTSLSSSLAAETKVAAAPKLEKTSAAATAPKVETKVAPSTETKSAAPASTTTTTTAVKPDQAPKSVVAPTTPGKTETTSAAPAVVEQQTKATTTMSSNARLTQLVTGRK